MKENNWTQQMQSLKVGDSFTTESNHYNTICTTRTRIKTKEPDVHYQVKLGKGLITVSRTK